MNNGAVIAIVGCILPLISDRPGVSAWPTTTAGRLRYSQCLYEPCATTLLCSRRIGFLVPEEDAFAADEAKTVASELRIPIVSQLSGEMDEFTHLLQLVPFGIGEERDGNRLSTYALALEPNDSERKSDRRRQRRSRPKSNPFYIDLCPDPNSRMAKRGSKQGGGSGDLLLKAVGPKRCAKGREGAVVYDLTAGLGQDSVVLARNGASKIVMVERDPIVAALLQDALRRLDLIATQAPTSDPRREMAISLTEKLSLHIGESIEVLDKLVSSADIPQPDIIYLDPMFPPRTKSSKVKKGMDLLHGLLDTQRDDGAMERLSDESRLLQAAFEKASARVVVKRPSRAEHLGGNRSIRPSYSIEGSINRWDVYVKN